MFKKILVPTDGSPLSERAVSEAIGLAKFAAAEIVALHVYERFRGSMYGAYGPSKDVVELQHDRHAKEHAEVVFAPVRAQADAAGVPLDTKLVQSDDVWKVVIDEAEQSGCDLVCMASHGRRGIAALVIASETNKVLTHSKVPVLVVR